MTTVTIYFAPAAMMMTMYTHGGKSAVPFVRAALREGQYADKSAEFNVDAEGEDAAEEAFDLTNNPGRQEEREQVYGRGRSLSVGDIVDTGSEKFVCMSMGWQKL